MKKQATNKELRRNAKTAFFRRGLIGVFLLPIGYLIAHVWQLAAHATF